MKTTLQQAGVDDAPGVQQTRSRSSAQTTPRRKTSIRTSPGDLSQAHENATEMVTQFAAAESILSAADVIQFMHDLATKREELGAINCVADALKRLIADVDEVVIALADAESASLHDESAVLEPGCSDGASPRASENRDSMFWHPIRFEYPGIDNHQIGSITLLRLRSRPAISERVTPIMTAVEGVLAYSLEAIAAHRRISDDTIPISADEWSRSLGLTRQEQRILACRMLGSRQREVADQFRICNDTVKRHMNNIYRKTGAKGFSALVAMCLKTLAQGRHATLREREVD